MGWTAGVQFPAGAMMEMPSRPDHLWGPFSPLS